MKELNNYLSNLAVMNTKLHNLHWNVKGRNFYQVHTFTEGLYDTIFEWYDQIAEAMKMRNEFPYASLKEYVENATIKEVESKDYSVDEVYAILVADYKSLREEATNLRNKADEAGDFTLVSLLEDHIVELDKNIWFLNSSK